MPEYRYQCETCGEFDVWRSIKSPPMTTHLECGSPVKQVFSMPFIAAEALPNKRAGIASTNQRDKQLDKDLSAYKSMAAQGLVPKHTDGAAELAARAQTREEIEQWGRPLPGKRKEIESKISQGKELADSIVPLRSTG